MAIGPRLDLRHSQQLVMTPQLQQAIKLLALSNLELESYINGELERNPLLEAAGETPAEPGAFDAPEPADMPEAPPDDWTAPDPSGADQLIAAGGGDADAPLDVDHAAETFHHDCASDMPAPGTGGLDGSLSVAGPAVAGAGGGEDAESFDATLAAELSLHDTLLAQLAGMDSVQQIIARHIIDLIDESGYFTGDLNDIGARLQIPTADVEAVLKIVHTFEPTGVGARSLGECLALQAMEADRYDPAMAALLSNLDLLARGEMATLRRLCGVDAEDLADMIAELRGYNPKPGLAYGGERPQPIMPDIFVARTASGGWAVEINAATLPRLLVNRSYYAELSGAGGKAAKSFLSDCLQSANWLIKALDQRQRTIIKVATELVRQQEAFFLHGVQHLRPLNLRAIADAIGMHESTVSRVTSNKYLSCERGLFELKYFFTSAIQAADGGDAVSAEAVKTKIRELIDGERGGKILSDDKLVELLNAAGFDIARRTVAKYREAMGIGSSVERRRAAAIQSAAA
ncbi:RNA polymerase factor sigma-54 [Sphingosinicella microcystinivorans]|uniref:RNA polymerase factor sigma-54 n=1 Tax=Sphingosinicella microcystinivorans TaxID=335406 RepID=UPI0022F4071D|nr:RNA polymerase factor sigma-54 [Sphingosinicella microcystinivorans]WBX84846.1 RNA polymerase factor sigma-54 [Sphingosinicella microcystinivorans]